MHLRQKRKRIPKVVGKLEGKNEAQANEFRIQKEDCNKKIEMIERQYESKMAAVEIDCKKRIAVVECNCAETLEETRVECVKLTSLFKNALATERKKNSMVVGELDAKIEAQAKEFRIELDECRLTFISTMEK